IRDESFLIDHLVRVATLGLVLNGIREGLTRHAWSDAQLAEMETNLANIDLLGEYAHIMRGERALNIGGVDYFRRHGLDGNILDGSENDGRSFGPLARVM